MWSCILHIQCLVSDFRCFNALFKICVYFVCKKQSHTRLQALGTELIPVFWQSVENRRFTFLPIRSNSVRNWPIQYRFDSKGCLTDTGTSESVLTGPSVYGPILMYPITSTNDADQSNQDTVDGDQSTLTVAEGSVGEGMFPTLHWQAAAAQGWSTIFPDTLCKK